LTTSFEKFSGLQAACSGVSRVAFLWPTFPAEMSTKNDVTIEQGNGGSVSSSRKELLLRADPEETLI
jgi:hypothetical protein